MSTPPGGFPAATLTVNLIGSLLLGFYVARRQRSLSGRLSVPFWGIGVLGSFTTFSAFSVEVVQLLGHSQVGLAVGYSAASVVGGLLAALVGQRIGSALR
jgi:fluoride exporter